MNHTVFTGSLGQTSSSPNKYLTTNVIKQLCLTASGKEERTAAQSAATHVFLSLPDRINIHSKLFPKEGASDQQQAN